MDDAFEFIEKPCSLRKLHLSGRGRTATTKYDIETPSYLDPKLQNLVPNEYKTNRSLEDFKAKIKTWVPKNCPWRLCKTCIHQVGFT